jgi:N-acetylmuramoyl-L-alanine amidase
MALVLTHDERTELEARLRSRKIRAEDARRARVILMLADGAAYSMIEATLPCYRDYINRWRRRFLAKRLAGPAFRPLQPTAIGVDPGHGGPDSGEDAPGAPGREHALEHAEARAPAADQSQPCRACVAARRAPAASVRALHAVG